MKKFFLSSFGYSGVILASILTVLFISPLQASAAPSLTVSVTVDHVDVGNQTANATTTTNNVAEVKASSTFAVSALPADNATTSIGFCVITFASTTGASETSCADRTVTIKYLVGSSTTNIATAISAITGATSSRHGAITFAVGPTATSSYAYTTGTEISSTTIEFSPVSGIATTSERTGVVPVAQVERITIGGTAASGNTFGFYSGSLSTSTTSVAGDTLQTIANKLYAAIDGTSGSSSLAYTYATGTERITLTAKTAGTAFTLATTSVSNFAGVSQVVTFTPANTVGNQSYVYSISIDSATSTYTFTGGSIKTLVEGLNSALASNASVASCTEDDAVITCTAVSPGVAFTYDTSAVASVVSSSGGNGGGGGGYYLAPASSNVPSIVPNLQTPAVVAGSVYSFKRPLTLKSKGADVTALQTRLLSEGVYFGPITGYFGQLTKQGVKNFQKKYGIDQLGNVGPKTRIQLNK